LFMEGMFGKFVWGIPVVVIIALSASLFEALIILPSHFADFVGISKAKGFKSRKELPWFKTILNFYTRVVSKALHRRYWVVLFGVLVVLPSTLIIAKIMPFIIFGSQEIEQFYIRAEAPIGTNLYTTDKLITQIEKRVEELPSNELDAYTTQVGSIGEVWMFDPYGKSGSHVAQVIVYVTPYTERNRSVAQIVDSLRNKTKGVSGFEDLYFEKHREGPPVGKAVAVEVRGDEYRSCCV